MTTTGPIPGPGATGPVPPPLPRLVFAPARPVRNEDRTELLYEVRRLPDGTGVLPVFTTRERLVEALGPAQPWAQAPLRAVRAIMAAAGVERVELDPELGEQEWRWTPQGLADFEGEWR
ncbi:SAV_915 family protein [Kitasatospora viridis]|uniref:Type III secretion system (T3SS) SseB-like protein n=1 Tax=Kitasatospora viridis TaxID=281105 RepID=A0A561UF00_9ACTN|nr:SAV_915 family protein [Kitasatospora viridis]TWF97918.1 type III secretion system (T3SS) SseB-like protein [Kitasatospora viridis]